MEYFHVHKQNFYPHIRIFVMTGSLFKGLLVTLWHWGHLCWGVTVKYDSFYIAGDATTITSQYTSNSETACAILYQRHHDPSGFFEFDADKGTCKIGTVDISALGETSSAELVRVMLEGRNLSNLRKLKP